MQEPTHALNPSPAPLRFVHRGEIVTLHNVPPTRTLLQVLREDLHCTGTKEGCNEGDCGACTVVVGEAVEGRLQTKAVNSCIKLAHSMQGQALWTVQDIAPPQGPLHPAQAAMVQCHGSQCGFCTPGFVMSLFALHRTHRMHSTKGLPISRSDAVHALSGNLCRCTGYRPILDAAQSLLDYPDVPLDEAHTLAQLSKLCERSPSSEPTDSAYLQPHTLAQLLQARAQYPQAQIVAGCTDVGLWVTKMHRQFAQVLDVTRVAELRRIEDQGAQLLIGAAATLSEAFAALVAQRPALAAFASRFAGLPVRNAGTLGGNVANGSPIGDSMPLLIALGAQVVLVAQRAGQMVQRTLPLEALYTGYRSNVIASDEVLGWITVPKPAAQERVRVYKISKRLEDDISAVCLALNLHIENGVVTEARVGVGGVAATPVRAPNTEAALRGQPWTPATVQAAQAALRAEFSPLSDLRASSVYRRTVLGHLLQRFWLESQGQSAVSLEDLDLNVGGNEALHAGDAA